MAYTKIPKIGFDMIVQNTKPGYSMQKRQNKAQNF